ncbi:MAG: rRNA maturation RNase YbeY [bacterium]|nr:rRNA maturation RNase YbeY [bacterium]
MTIHIEYEAEEKLGFDYEAIITNVINEAMDYEECPYESEVEVVITDNERIHEVNKEFREIDRPTDVLSFPMVEYEAPGDFSVLEECDDCFNPETGELLLGDIMISVDKVKEQAASYGHSEERELGFLVAHSMLHLFGYDHMEDDEREVMEKKQEEILQNIAIVRE